MTPTVVLLLATLLAATAQTVAGFGFALVAVPLYVTSVPVTEAVGVIAVLSFLNVAAVARSVRGHVPWAIVGRLLAGSLVGMPFGLALLLGVSGDVLRIVVGAVSIVLAFAIARGFTVRAHGRAGTVGVGWVAGVLSTSIAINGPPIVLFLQALRVRPEVFRAALSTFFFVNGTVSLSVFVASGVVDRRTLFASAVALPALVLGHWLGHRLLPRFRPATFRRFVLALLVASALTSLIDGVARLWR